MSPDSFWNMTLREFICAINGFSKREQRANIVAFEMAKFNAKATAMGKKQAEAIQKVKNPFQNKQRKTEPLTMDDVMKLIPSNL